MKAVLMSIQPKWCELIASGKKTVEVRKTKPKIETPFRVYIYQTRRTWIYDIYSRIADWQGKVIGEFVCDSIIQIGYNKNGYGLDDFVINGVIAKSCVPEEELYHYLQGKKPYLWHISDLIIYDKPKELSEFYKYTEYDDSNNDIRPCRFCEHNKFDWSEICEYCDIDFDGEHCFHLQLKRPPQSWCYVEELR